MVRTVLAASMLGAALMASTSLSWSADALVEQEVAATGPSWTGFYIGAHGGGAFGNMEYTLLPVLPGDETTGYSFGSQDFAYGVHGGFDFQFTDRWVAGLELAYTQLDSNYSPFESGGFGTLVEVKSIYSLSARAGYLLTPEALIYARLGYAGIHLDEAEDGFDAIQSGTVGAVQVGIGAETFLTDNITARMEANYYHATEEFVLENDGESFDPRYLLVTAGLSYRFGAQNGSSYAVEPAPEMDWNGFYAGVHGSYNFGAMHLDVDVPGATLGPFNAQSAGAGAFIGYDFQIGSSYVVGIEADATYLNARFEDPSQNSLDPTAPTLFATVNAALALTARVGYIATPSTLVYVKGGFAGLQIDANEEFFGLDGGGSKMLSAYQVGAGVESAVTEKLTLRVEGLYTEALDGIVVANSQPLQNELTPSLLTGKIGLAYRF